MTATHTTTTPHLDTKITCTEKCLCILTISYRLQRLRRVHWSQTEWVPDPRQEGHGEFRTDNVRHSDEHNDYWQGKQLLYYQ